LSAFAFALCAFFVFIDVYNQEMAKSIPGPTGFEANQGAGAAPIFQRFREARDRDRQGTTTRDAKRHPS
jgi:hypothetical protein